MTTLAPKLPWRHAFAGGYPGVGGQALPTDPDAIDYLERLAAADGAPVEVGVAQAIDAFVKGCKADASGVEGRSNWDAIKSSCILCGARTLAGALVSLRQYGPELVDINNLPTPTITDLTGSVGAWDATSRTASNSAFGTNATYPHFRFNFGAVAGTEYRVTGRFSGDLSSIYGFRADLGPGSAYYVDIDPVTGEFSKTISFINSNMQLLMRGDLGPSSVRIESLSIREVINDATNVSNNFTSTDYNRGLLGTDAGLKGDGSTTYLDTNRTEDADPQDDVSFSVYRTELQSANGLHNISSGLYSLIHGTLFRNRTNLYNTAHTDALGFKGSSRGSASSFDWRVSGATTTAAEASIAPTSANWLVFRRGDTDSGYSDSRIAFYHVGSALDLAALDTRVTNLVNAIRFTLATGFNPAGYEPETIAYILAGYENGGSL